MKLLSKISLTATLAIVVRLAGPYPALATTTNVIVGPNNNLTYSPTNVTIHAGDRVIWTWAGTIEHSTTSGTNGFPSGLWDSGLHAAPFSFTNTFTSPGVFTYYCTLHWSFGMTGVVQVLPLPSQPIVLTNAMRLTNGGFGFTVLSTANQTNIVQGSTNLAAVSNWVSLDTNVPATNAFIFSDTNATRFPLRFYRVVQP